MLKFLAMFLFCLNITLVFGQQCGTDIMYERAIKNNPEYKKNKEKLDSLCSEAANADKHKYPESSSALKIIPVVFHVMHNYTAENISDAQIIDAVHRLNIDFKKHRNDTNLIAPIFKSVAADCEIEFRLAQKDPLGNCTNGITRTATNLTYNANDNVKQIVNWEHTKYLNIWVVSNINIGVGNVAGYAYYPGAGNNMDGIVILSDHVGGIGTSSPSGSTTLTHEVGHYLELAHTWGSSNSCGDPNNCSIDDGITDTPNTIGNCHSCNLSSSTCGVTDNVQNFMEYSSCRMMFTTGQKNWMQNALTSWPSRQNLWSAANLLATGVNGSSPICAPISDFNASQKMICTGAPVTFTEHSWNGAPSAWHWSFPGASITSSTNSSETVTYNSPGIYTVSLAVYNSAGGDSIAKTSYIMVSSATATHTLSSYSEGFEGISIPNSDWTVFDEKGGNAWITSSITSYSGNTCAYLNNHANTTNYTTDEFISSGIDISKIQSPMGSFMYSYVQQSNEDDMLEVYASSNCGTTWNLRFSLTGMYLFTAPSQFSSFFPSSQSEWKKGYINLAPFINSSNVMLKFKFTSRMGNNIFIDDINISSFYIGMDENLNPDNSLLIYPNPVKDNTEIKINLTQKNDVTLAVYDVTGREVISLANATLEASEHTFTLNKQQLNSGIYFVKLITNEKQHTRKIVVE